MVLLLLLPRTLAFPFIKPSFWFEDWSQFPTLRFISIGILFSYLLTTLVAKAHSFLLKILIYFVLYVLFFLNIFLAFNFNATISPNTLLLALETTPAESYDFLSTYSLSLPSIFAYLVTFSTIVITILLETKSERIIRWVSNSTKCNKYRHKLKCCLEIIFLLLLLCGLFSFRLYPQLLFIDTVEQMDRWNPKGLSSMDFITGLVYSCYDLNLTSKVLSRAVEVTIQATKEKPDLLNPEDSCSIILVIGESFIKKHSSLYGYRLKTNPKLEREEDAKRLFVFKDVVSPSASTSASIRNILSCNSIGDGEQWYDFPYFPTIFKNAGYDVYFWDNQYHPTSNAGFDFSLNSYLHNSQISSITYNSWHGQISRQDGDIVNDYKKYRKEHPIGRKNFIIFHLQGMHFKQETRYPQSIDFLKFKSADIDRKETWMTEEKKIAIAHYDNCTFYNDSVISSIISIFRNEPAVLVYFSDHGEHIYDVGDYYGRGLNIGTQNKAYACHLFEIPFVVWCSEKYIHRYPEMCRRLKDASKKPMMTDNICSFLMTLGGVKTRYYNESRDILSEMYKCPPRIINNSIDYDKELK